MRSRYFLAALLIHIALFIMVATVVIFKAPKPPADAEFQAVHVPVPPAPPPPEPPASGEAANIRVEPQPDIIPPTAPQQIISNLKSTAFKVDTSKALAQALSHLSVPAPQSSGLTQGGGNLRGLGSSSAAGFFGLQTEGKRIAFLLDYSGSMEGVFRQTMEKQLEASLSQLPAGTQVILICWAGPAWLYNQTAPQIARKWRKIDTYDNFTLVPGATLDPPQWIDVTPESVADIMKGIKAQVSAPGGTDWRQPFRYAMKADPPPDVIFFLTDGQIPPKTADRALSAISTALSKADPPPQVNCLWIENPTEKSDKMEELAQKFQGEFRRVSAKSIDP